MTPYDAWKLTSPEDEGGLGTDFGQICGRYHEPDDDAPRGYRPRPCSGVIEDINGVLMCDTCGEIVGEADND